MLIEIARNNKQLGLMSETVSSGLAAMNISSEEVQVLASEDGTTLTITTESVADSAALTDLASQLIEGQGFDVDEYSYIDNSSVDKVSVAFFLDSAQENLPQELSSMLEQADKMDDEDDDEDEERGSQSKKKSKDGDDEKGKGKKKSKKNDQFDADDDDDEDDDPENKDNKSVNELLSDEKEAKKGNGDSDDDEKDLSKDRNGDGQVSPLELLSDPDAMKLVTKLYALACGTDAKYLPNFWAELDAMTLRFRKASGFKPETDEDEEDGTTGIPDESSVDALMTMFAEHAAMLDESKGKKKKKGKGGVQKRSQWRPVCTHGSPCSRRQKD